MNFKKLSFAVCFFLCCIAISAGAKDPDEGRTTEELVAARGFLLQSHSVQTKDGYILTLHRIVPKGPFNQTEYSRARKPVILQHGLFGTSADFMLEATIKPEGNGTCGDSFPFCLLLTGRYDVWLPNSRGNKHSNRHAKLSTFNPKYWEFTFDHMAVYDTPAAISFIKNYTGYQKFGYVGHSQGAGSMFALLSLKPEYSSIIQPFISWAPAVFIGQMTSQMRRLIGIVPLLQLTGGPFIASSKLGQEVLELVCGVPIAGQPVCANSLEGMMGKTNLLNRTRLPVYMSFFPDTVSNWDLVHFSQLYQCSTFTRYDYGSPLRNLKEYGSRKVPLYPLEAIPAETKVAIFRGNTDAFVVKEDALRLVSTLQKNGINVIDIEVAADPFNHMDFLTAMGVGKLVYDQTVKLLDELM